MSETRPNLKTTTTRTTTPPPEEWKVPAYLQGLSCVLCTFPFKDGDTHGEMETQADGSIALVCRTKKDPPA